MASASRRVDTVNLTMDIQEAKILVALLYTCVGGTGSIRGALTDYPTSIENALQTVMDGRYWSLNGVKGANGIVDVTEAELDYEF